MIEDSKETIVTAFSAFIYEIKIGIVITFRKFDHWDLYVDFASKFFIFVANTTVICLQLYCIVILQKISYIDKIN